MLTWTEEAAGRLRHQASRSASALPSAALLRATRVNGASNLSPAPLPDLAAGCGWGRVNLRQNLAPAQPVTLQLRDDGAIGPGGSLRYRSAVPGEFRGNLWQTVAGRTHLSRPVLLPALLAGAHEDIQPFKRRVLANPAPGVYEVEVEVAAAFAACTLHPQNLQAFAWVFAGTGPAQVLALPLLAVPGAAVY